MRRILPSTVCTVTLLTLVFLLFSLIPRSSSGTEGGEKSDAISAAAYVSSAPSYPVLLGQARPLQTGEISTPCPNRLARILKNAGFRGENLREAWAVAMRESRGHRRSISSTHDYGLFQFNKATWDEEKWWEEKRLLKAGYNARIAFRLSDGGRTWYLWGLDGRGRVKAHLYRSVGWSDKRIREHIVEPYQRFYDEYGSLSPSCR